MSLQISVAPADLPHAREILPHQLRQWGAQVDEVVFTLDLGRGGGRARRGREEQRVAIVELLEDLCTGHPNARIAQVDYAGAAVDEVGQRFFAGRVVPYKDCYGKAVYPYFFGLLCACERYVLHLDSDMMFGGGSQTWADEALRLFATQPHLFSCSPLPGPPSARPFRRPVAIGHAGSGATRDLATNAVPHASPGLAGPAFRFARMSTRDFIVDRSLFQEAGVTLERTRPELRTLLAATARGAIVRGDPRAAPAETCMSRAMAARDLMRIDFLGARPGMWSVHPARRTDAVLRALPELIARIERGDVTDGQRGEFDLHGSMVPRTRPALRRGATRRRAWTGR